MDTCQPIGRQEIHMINIHSLYEYFSCGYFTLIQWLVNLNCSLSSIPHSYTASFFGQTLQHFYQWDVTNY